MAQDEENDSKNGFREVNFSGNLTILELEVQQYEAVLHSYMKFRERDNWILPGHGLPDWFLQNIENLYRFLVEDCEFEDEISTKCLAILGSELLFFEEPQKREQYRIYEILPNLLSGIERALEILEDFEQNGLNVERIHFDVRRELLSKGHKFSTRKDLQKTGNPVRKTIDGIEVINTVMHAVQKERKSLEAMMVRYQKMLKDQHTLSKKESDLRTASAKRMAPVIHRFFVDTCGIKSNDAVHNTALILSGLGYMPKLDIGTTTQDQRRKKLYDNCYNYIFRP